MSASRRSLMFVIAILLALSSGTSANSQPGTPDGPNDPRDCRFPRFVFSANGTSTVSMTVRKGAVCKMRFYTSGSIQGLRQTVRPMKGTFGISNNTFTAYRAGNVVGTDRFVVKVDWERAGTRVFTNVDVQVVIVERLN